MSTQQRELVTMTGGTYLNIMSLPDGRGYMLGGRQFEKVLGRLYFDDGTVTRLDDGVERFGLAQSYGEYYSRWTDEQRESVRVDCAEKKAAWERENAEREKQWQDHQTKRAALIKSAQVKLTEAEFEAIKEQAAEDAEEY